RPGEARAVHRALAHPHPPAAPAGFIVGARRADRLAPAQRAVGIGELLELRAHLDHRLPPLLRREPAVAEEAAGGRDTADLQAFAFDGLETAADDALGRAAADVDHQPQTARLGRLGVGDPEVDQAR